MPPKKNIDKLSDKWILEALNNWELDDYDDIEFVDWDDLPKGVSIGKLIDDKLQVNYLWVKINWDSLNKNWVNTFGNKQPIVKVNRLKEINGTIYEMTDTHLAMGKRLYNRMLTALRSGWNHIEIVRTINPESKFSAQYYIREKKPTKQTTIYDFSF